MAEDFISRIAPWREAVEAQIEANLRSPVPLVQEIGSYILLSGGKRLRPILFILAAELCGRREKNDALYSTIFEFVHCATLLHDDVIDYAETRRGQPSANRRWDNQSAVLVGDHLLARALSLAAQTGKPTVIDALAKCIARLAEGQVLELANLGDLETPYALYLEIITGKTAVLLAAATQVGAIFAGVPSEREEALYRFGLDLGVAFQMIDDLLDLGGDEKLLGKPVGQDIREGKATLPWICALEKASPETRRDMITRATKPDLGQADIDCLRRTVIEMGGIEASQAKAEEVKERAKTHLNIFGPSPERQILHDLADYVCRRRF